MLNVPLPTNMEFPEIVNALPRVQPPPTPKNVIKVLTRVTPFVVMVFPVVVDLKFILPLGSVGFVTEKLVAGNVSDPYTSKYEFVENDSVIAPSSAPPAPPVEKSRHTAGAEDVPVTVTVNGFVPTFEPASNITSSADVGGPNPLDPPLVSDQLAVLVASQLPDPPTQ